MIETELGWNESEPKVLSGYRNAIMATCRNHDWLLSRIGILSNHFHILIGAGIDDSPERVSLALMNNIAFSQALKPVLRYSYYAGTFGNFDRGVIWNALKERDTE